MKTKYKTYTAFYFSGFLLALLFSMMFALSYAQDHHSTSPAKNPPRPNVRVHQFDRGPVQSLLSYSPTLQPGSGTAAPKAVSPSYGLLPAWVEEAWKQVLVPVQEHRTAIDLVESVQEVFRRLPQYK